MTHKLACAWNVWRELILIIIEWLQQETDK